MLDTLIKVLSTILFIIIAIICIISIIEFNLNIFLTIIPLIGALVGAYLVCKFL